MAKIFSVNPFHEIFIDEKCILRNDDDFISIELPAGFNWHHHALNCIDCKAFLGSFGKSTYQWLVQIGEEYNRIDLVGFGELNDYNVNLSRFESSSGFHGTKWRFKIREINRASLEALKIIRQDEQQYERCAELRDINDFLNKIGNE